MNNDFSKFTKTSSDVIKYLMETFPAGRRLSPDELYDDDVSAEQKEILLGTIAILYKEEYIVETKGSKFPKFTLTGKATSVLDQDLKGLIWDGLNAE